MILVNQENNDLTNCQKNTLNSVMIDLGESNGSPRFFPNFDFITIGGYAGTGKTFLLCKIRKEINNKWKNLNIAFCSFTGKASSVLKSKLIENNSFYNNDYCGTIHSLIYTPEFHFDKKLKKFTIKRWIKKDKIPYDLIIVDEGSMINLSLWNDLVEYHIPIIVAGDHGQLPPVGDDFNIIKNPKYILNEIRRQNIDNPIIRLSQDIRNGMDIPFGFYDEKNKTVFKTKWDDKETQQFFNNLDFNNENIIVLCGTNKTRAILNRIIRKNLKYSFPEPYPGERVICLRNNHYNKIMNGQLGTLLFLLYEGKNVYNASIRIDGFSDVYSGLIYKETFGRESYEDCLSDIIQKRSIQKIIKESDYDQIDLFDFGYAISVHKSQGSEWNKVILFQERSFYWNDDFYKKWLYTAVTRSKEKLFVIT